jgi:hypothetical protein
LTDSSLHRRLTSSVLAILLIGCGSLGGTAINAAPISAQPAEPLTASLRALFDDAIDPEVFSTPAESAFEASDRRISDRIRYASFVVTVVVVTVTDESSSSSGHQELELMPVDPPIHGTLEPFVSPGEPIRVRLGGNSVSTALVRSYQNELVGKRMNLCWGRFVDGAETVDHWHAFSDSPKTKQLLKRAAAIVDFD